MKRIDWESLSEIERAMLRLLHQKDRILLRPCKCPTCNCDTAEDLQSSMQAALREFDRAGYVEISEDFTTETDAWWIAEEYVTDVGEYFSDEGYYAELRDAEERRRNELAMTPFLPGLEP